MEAKPAVTLPDGTVTVVPHYKETKWYKKQKEKQTAEYEKYGGKPVVRITCECGSNIQVVGYYTHINTKSHIEKMKVVVANYNKTDD